MTCAPLSSRLNTPTPPMTHRLHTSMTMSSFSGIHLRFSHNKRCYRSLWILSNTIALKFMMASKARLFGDDTALSAILASNDPRDQKCLGRQVRHFDHELWQSACESIVLHGNPTKFSQNEEMHLALIQTGNRRPAEARPTQRLT